MHNSLVSRLAVMTALVGTMCFSHGAHAQSPQTDRHEPADSVYTNGRIYTVNTAQPWAEAVAIRAGKFVKVGSTAVMKPLIGKATKVVDLEGRFVLPGIHDTHVHPPLVYKSEEAGNLLFPESFSKQEIQDALREFVKKHPDKQRVRGDRWSVSLFPDGKAHKSFIDEVVSDRPVLLGDSTVHNAVANSATLKLAGITRDTPDPPGGKIDRDPKTGEPTGYLTDAAMDMVAKLFPKADAAAYARATKRSLAEMRRYGITSFIDMATTRETLEAYVAMEKAGTLNYRVQACILAPSRNDPLSLIHSRKDYETRLVDPNHVKFSADGAPSTYTSLLVEPYTSRPETYGQMVIFQRQIDMFKSLDAEGVTIHIHSIGDGTTRRMLDAIGKVRKENPNSSLRHHLAHCALVHPNDYPRFKALNVTAEFSPAVWCPTGISNSTTRFVGGERMHRWMPIKMVSDTGAAVSYGSDWPVMADANPWRGLEAMITRQDPTGKLPGTLGVPINLATGIRILTLGGAYAMQQENEVGSIETGKCADFIILEENLFDMEKADRLDEISETKVLTSVFEGKTVYSARERSIP